MPKMYIPNSELLIQIHSIFGHQIMALPKKCPFEFGFVVRSLHYFNFSLIGMNHGYKIHSQSYIKK